MALTESVDRVDESGRELLTYGTEDFPVAFFDDDLSIVPVPPHWHNEFEIIIVTEGRVHVRIAGKEMTLLRGDGYFANSGILHSAELLSKSGHQHAMVFSPYAISMREDLIWKRCVAPILNNPRIPFIRLTAAIPWQKEVLAMAESAWQYGAYEKADYPIHVRGLLSLSFARIASQAETVEDESIYTDKYRMAEIRIKKALMFIEGNYSSCITLEEIAQSASISESACLRLFKALLGTTPIRYLIDYRLQRFAEQLQAQEGKTISEIAYLCGFTDASYFNRCFRKKYGLTPTEYIKQKTL